MARETDERVAWFGVQLARANMDLSELASLLHGFVPERKLGDVLRGLRLMARGQARVSEGMREVLALVQSLVALESLARNLSDGEPTLLENFASEINYRRAQIKRSLTEVPELYVST